MNELDELCARLNADDPHYYPDPHGRIWRVAGNDAEPIDWHEKKEPKR